MKEGLSIEGGYIIVWEDNCQVIQIKKPASISLREVGAYAERVLKTGCKTKGGFLIDESRNKV